MSVSNLEEDNAEAPEATVVTDSPQQEPSKSSKTKKPVPSKAGPSQGPARANGTKKTAQIKPKGKKDFPSRPKKAKIDGETVKKPAAGTPAAKTADETKSGKDGKRDGSRFEKKQGKKQRKTPTKKKSRMGKNKFNKLKKMLVKQDGGK